jgi:hypothetical protein
MQDRRRNACDDSERNRIDFTDKPASRQQCARILGATLHLCTRDHAHSADCEVTSAVGWSIAVTDTPAMQGFTRVPRDVDISTSESSRECTLSWAVMVRYARSRTGPGAYAALMLPSQTAFCWRNSPNGRSVRDRGVGGSNPLAPTTSINKYGLRFDVTSDLRPFLLSFFRTRPPKYAKLLGISDKL